MLSCRESAFQRPCQIIEAVGLSHYLRHGPALPCSLSVTGLGGEAIRGIDFRPATGEFFAIGQAGSLFRIDLSTGAATTVAVSAIPVGAVDLDFGFAFNPVPNRIRTVTATDKNFRTNPTDGANIVDMPLAYAAGDANAGVDPTVTAVAYTNQVAGPVTTTTLYGIDAATSSLVLQSPPNDGVLGTVGSLGVTLAASGFGIGFDIDGTSGMAFASFAPVGGSSGLYDINLATGTASLLGGFGGYDVSDIAVGSFAVPEPASLSVLGAAILAMAGLRRRRNVDETGKAA